jgi:hypothetical protein
MRRFTGTDCVPVVPHVRAEGVREVVGAGIALPTCHVRPHHDPVADPARRSFKVYDAAAADFDNLADILVPLYDREGRR